MQRIESLRAAVGAADLDATWREEAMAHLDAAAADEQAAARARGQAAGLRAEAAELERPQDRSRRPHPGKPAQALQDWADRLPSEANVELLEDLLARQRQTIGELSIEIEEAETELARILSQPAESSVEIAALRRRAEAASAPIAPDPAVPRVVLEARELRREAERHRLEAELELRRTEQDTLLERQRAQELALGELKSELATIRARVAWLQARIAERTRELLAARVEAVKTAAESDATRGGVVATVARETASLAEELLEQNELLEEERAELSRVEQARDAVVASLQDSRTRLELGGTSSAAGRWLWSERRRLESPARLERLRESRDRELVELRLRRVTLSDAQRELDDVAAAAKGLVEEGLRGADDESGLAEASEAVEPWLARKAELLALLDPIVQRRVRALEQLSQALRSQRETTLALRHLLDRHLLWTPSHAPIDATWLDRVPQGLSDLVKPSRWATTVRLTTEAIVAHPFRTLCGVLLLALLIVLRQRAPRRILEQADVTRRIADDHIGATLVALGWTVAAALPAPVALTLLGWLLQTAGTPGRYSDSLGRTCLELAVPVLAFEVLWWTSIEQGLGHAHFRWTRARRSALRRILPAAAAVVLPMDFIAVLAFIRNLDLPNDVQARSAIAIACVAIAVAFWRLFDVGRVWVLRGIESQPSRLRRVVRIGLPAAALALAGLALAGYVYSAGLLLQSLLDSIAAIVAVTLVVGLLGRWSLIGERRLALRRIEEQRAHPPNADEGASEVAEDTLTLERVNAQTQRILRVVRIGLLGVTLLWIWAGILPAVTRLDSIVLWTFSATGPDGIAVEQPVTLFAVVLGLLLLVLTVVGSRNLPGLVELALIARTNVDAATRYAIASLLRYAIVIAGTVAGLEQLGLRWSQLQWLAAALTVGLGFGLQEIFANFVSGLILLFERPFRVGDVISVADLTGRVTRIRTRATTILDFDNREIVVPNKSFITGQLLNWTLSDTTTRVTIRVGVAYGSDPERVHEILLAAARSHPKVLTDPEPLSWFLAFGASSLDFELRVFVGALLERLPVQSDLHREIARRFADAGIEIAFPQMDVHVRDLPGQGGAGSA